MPDEDKGAAETSSTTTATLELGAPETTVADGGLTAEQLKALEHKLKGLGHKQDAEKAARKLGVKFDPNRHANFDDVWIDYQEMQKGKDVEKDPKKEDQAARIAALEKQIEKREQREAEITKIAQDKEITNILMRVVSKNDAYENAIGSYAPQFVRPTRQFLTNANGGISVKVLDDTGNWATPYDDDGKPLSVEADFARWLKDLLKPGGIEKALDAQKAAKK